MLEGTLLGSAYTPFMDSQLSHDVFSPSVGLSYNDLLANTNMETQRGKTSSPPSPPAAATTAPPQIKISSQQPTIQTSSLNAPLPSPQPYKVSQQQMNHSKQMQQSLYTSQPQIMDQQNLVQNQMPSAFDPNAFNRQFEISQKKMLIQQQQQQAQTQPYIQNQPLYTQQQPIYVQSHTEDGYWEKLSIKKKDIWKFMQSGFIILFAISVHYFIDFILKYYLSNYDISFERELFLRILYPIAVLFIAWNIIAHLK